jgi:FkbM family methyltransferase
MATPRAQPPSGDLSALGRLVARHRRSMLVRKVAGLCRRYLSWYGNLSYDLETNGEAFVLETLARFAPQVLFDVGANVGDWTAAAKARCPQATVHAFELAPPTFDTLVARTRHLAGVRCLNLGLSDAPGTVRFRHFTDLPALSTASDYPHPFPSVELVGEVTTGDLYAAQAGLDHVDLLKIDVEGMEKQVLAGFSGLLARGAVDVVQFEYGRVSILNRFLLRDFHAFFRERGYVVGKVFPTYVDFRDYDLGDEDFVGPNYLACREARADYRRALGGGS